VRLRLLLPLLLALAAPALAGAATVAPSATARAAIIHAFGDPPAAASCLKVRLAASDTRYAEVLPRIASRCDRWAFNGVNVLLREPRGAWKVLFEGSSYRCFVPRIPQQVQRDLGVCPH
jgi:hypothetical protein